MSEIPEDIRATALALSLCHKEPRRGCCHPDDNSCEDNCELLESIAEALMAERECGAAIMQVAAAKRDAFWVDGRKLGGHDGTDLFISAAKIDAAIASLRSPDTAIEGRTPE